MATFTAIAEVETWTSKDKTIKVQIVKFKKDNTERIFFAPRFENKALNSTMFTRLYDARNLAKNFIKYKETKINK